MHVLRSSALLLLLAIAAWSPRAAAQTLPVQVSVNGSTATVVIGDPDVPIADVTLAFEDVAGLTPASLGVSAQLVDITEPSLVVRLPGGALTLPQGAFPLLITIEPPALGGLRFRTVRVDVHTHALPYAVGSPLRLFKAPLSGNFTDITDEIAPGSVRARGTTGGFSQFLVLADLRPTSLVVASKLSSLRARVATLPVTERPAFNALLDAIESDVASGNFAAALASVDAFRTRATQRAGVQLLDEWRATRDGDNQAGDLIAGAATLRFSVAFLRDFGD